MDSVKGYLPPLARLLMSSLFIWSGILYLRKPGTVAQYFTALHVPVSDVAVWVAAVIELAGGLAILLGFKTRWAAAVLAILCLGTAFGVHLPAESPDHSMIMFYKNLAMAGGFFYVLAYGPGGISIDRATGREKG